MRCPRFVLSFMALSCLFFACKARNDSQISSLTHAELEACETFNGARLFFMLNPASEFNADVTRSHELFIKQMSSSNLFTQYSYFTDGNGKISKPCALYVGTDQAKYELAVPTLSGPLATKAEFIKSMEALGRVIRARRLAQAAKDPALQQSYQIQVMLNISSHGTAVESKQHPSGGIALSPPKASAVTSHQKASSEAKDQVDFISFEEISSLLSQYLMTICPVDDPNCDEPKNRRADEITIITDSCFSGTFHDALKNHLKSLNGYQNLVSKDARRTRILSFVSSAGTQTSVGSFANSGQGTLTELMSISLYHWLADYNNDNIISYPELAQFITKDYEPTLLAHTNLLLEIMLYSAIKGESKIKDLLGSAVDIRSLITQEARTDKARYDRLFANPLQALRADAYLDGKVMLQKPDFFTNTQPDFLNSLLFAVRGNSEVASGTVTRETFKESFETSANHLKDLIVLWKAIIAAENKSPTPSKEVINADKLDLKEAPFIYQYVIAKGDTLTQVLSSSGSSSSSGASGFNPSGGSSNIDSSSIIVTTPPLTADANVSISTLEVLQVGKSLNGINSIYISGGEFKSPSEAIADEYCDMEASILASKRSIKIERTSIFPTEKRRMLMLQSSDGKNVMCTIPPDGDPIEAVNEHIAKGIIKLSK